MPLPPTPATTAPKIGGTATAAVVGNVGGANFPRTLTGSDSTGESAYVPLLELDWRHAFSPELRMFVDASGVKRSGGTINGKIYSSVVGVEWIAHRAGSWLRHAENYAQP